MKSSIGSAREGPGVWPVFVSRERRSGPDQCSEVTGSRSIPRCQGRSNPSTGPTSRPPVPPARTAVAHTGGFVPRKRSSLPYRPFLGDKPKALDSYPMLPGMGILIPFEKRRSSESKQKENIQEHRGGPRSVTLLHGAALRREHERFSRGDWTFLGRGWFQNNKLLLRGPLTSLSLPCTRLGREGDRNTRTICMKPFSARVVPIKRPKTRAQRTREGAGPVLATAPPSTQGRSSTALRWTINFQRLIINFSKAHIFRNYYHRENLTLFLSNNSGAELSSAAEDRPSGCAASPHVPERSSQASIDPGRFVTECGGFQEGQLHGNPNIMNTDQRWREMQDAPAFSTFQRSVEVRSSSRSFVILQTGHREHRPGVSERIKVSNIQAGAFANDNDADKKLIV